MVISKKQKPCCVCGKLTNRVDEDYEEFICSEECEKNLNRETLMTFDEMIEELKSESPEARQFYERCEKMAEKMELFGDLTWWDRLTADISAWIQIILHRIKRKQ